MIKQKTRSKKRLKKLPLVKRQRQRHPIYRRVHWWLRARLDWFRGLKKWQKWLVIGGPIVLVVLVIPLITFLYFALTMGNMEHIMNRNNTGVVLQDLHGTTFYSTGTAEHRDLVTLDKIADPMEQALVASEDRNFYEHGGFSILSTLRAVYGYIFSGGGSFGGSTITQQLAKMTLLSSDRSALRQYQAFSVAIALEQRYTKDEILAMYLNTAYFGNNSFGVEQAAKNYFDKKPSELTLAESSMLIGLLPAPSAYSPVTGDADMAAERQSEVLKRMVREGMITEEERTDALKQELKYQPPVQIKNDAPHFTQMVLNELYETYGEERVERSGYQVTTSLDLKLQRTALKNVADQLSYIEQMGGSNAGLIAIDPDNGEIRALVGSVDYQNEDWGNVNMATAKRQPGSTFKPIYYSAALADGTITPATILKDEPINIGGYQPHNATRQYYGDVTVRQALDRSLNIPSVKVMQRFGIAKSIAAAKSLGITTLDKEPSDYGLSLAIGSAEVPLIEMTNAYASFANGGMVNQTTTIHQINNKFGRTIFTHKAESKRGISAQGAYLISDILADQQARSFMFGSALDIPGKTVAVKTGTTDENRDAWTIGYTPEIAIGVWVGNNDNHVMVSGGSDMAGPIWKPTMRAAIGNNNPEFIRPTGIVERNVCYGTGGLANNSGSNTYREVFLVSALPTASCQATPRQTDNDDSKQSSDKPDNQPAKPDEDDDIPPVDDEGEDDDDSSSGGEVPPDDEAGGDPVGPGGQSLLRSFGR